MADALWLSRGYAGFSFADLSTRTGLRKPSVYHHFPSKEALFIALIEHHEHEAAGFFETMDTRPANEALGAFLEVYGRLLEHPDRLCPAGAICADLEVMPAAVAASGRLYLRAQQSWLTATMDRGPWRFCAEDMAATVLSALQGALQRSRGALSPVPLERTLRMLRVQLELG
ncbi:MAG: TetR/AcrR family transcriptional regulator [Nannocystales bacterium]